MPTAPPPAEEQAACKLLFACHGKESGTCSHAASVIAQRERITSGKAGIFERWGFSGYVTRLKTSVLPFCAHPEQLREALKSKK